MKKYICLILCLVIAFTVFTSEAFAYSDIDFSIPISLNVKFVYEDTPIPGTQFDVYYIAASNVACTSFTLTGTFLNYIDNVTNLSKLEQLDTDEWQTLANDLKALVKSENIAPLCSGITDSNGTVSFSASNGTTLSPGIYLVSGSECSYEGYKYIPYPSLVMLPSFDDSAQGWIYDVTMEPKREREAEPVEEKTVDITVTKNWNDSKYSLKRPSEVTVNLYDGDSLYETVKLNADNSWTYVWKGLPEDGDWSVTENKVDYYTTSISRNGNVFVITNTPINSLPYKPWYDYYNKLPQTGVLQWPIPVAAFCGLAFILIGVKLRKREQ